MILLVDNYDSFTFNLFQMLQEQAEEPIVVHRNDAIGLSGVQAMAPRGIVLSPGPGHPGNQSDFGVCADVIQNAEQLKCPILGVCLGHQGIAHHLGGRVERAPHIVHGKTSAISTCAESKLFDGLPKTFRAMRYHSLVVSANNFPEDLDVTAKDDSTGLIMALQHKRLPVFGLQFHPESIGTPDGKSILRNFLSLC
ncbi:MAG TPA: aminodeoxychorismate/anthranilate synthase component II [Candidatus Obscuribacterales bacterium]